ncbi:MAG: FecR protein, partial [Verrucomicrobiales bacterium]|nr:FecR protein [Verrucomicrobiales bacterium]
MTKMYSSFKALIACALALVVLTASAEAAAMKKSKAKAHGVRGDVQYRVADGPWMAVHNGDEFDSQTSIKTIGPDAVVNLSIAHNNSSVRVLPNTMMRIENLNFVGGADGDSETMLNVQSGTIVGSVEKLSRASHYEIRTPNGVAGIRGTDYAISVEQLADGSFRVTFTCVQGEVIAAALGADGNAVTQVLDTGESWTPGAGMNKTTPELLEFLNAQIKEMLKHL